MAYKYTVAALTLGFLGYNACDETEEVFKAVTETGYDGIDLFDFAEKRDLERIKRAAASTGLKIPEVMGNWGGADKDLACEDEGVRNRAIQYGKEVIDVCVELGSPTLGYCMPQPTSAEAPFTILPIEVLKKNLVNSLKAICNYAADHGIHVVIEPLNCYESYPCLMNTISETMSVINELGCDNVGLQPDVFHMNIGEASILNALRSGGTYVKHIHMNETNHFSFGAGHADLKGIFRTLKEIDFTGYITVYMPLVSRELFNLGFRDIVDKGITPAKADLKSYLGSAIDHLKRIERSV